MINSHEILQNGVRLCAKFAKQSRHIKANLSTRSFSLYSMEKSSSSSGELEQLALSKLTGIEAASEIEHVTFEDKTLNVTFVQNTKKMASPLLSEDGRHFDSKFNEMIYGENYQSLCMKIQPTSVQHNGNTLKVTWSDGHTSIYDSRWLYQRTLKEESTKIYDKFFTIAEGNESKSVTP